jgi:hypothetical protein
MTPGLAVLILLCLFIGAERLASAPEPSGPSSSEGAAVERFLATLEKTPVPYQARRRLEASSSKLQESGWMEVVTQYDPNGGFSFSVVAEGGSERIRRRVLRKVLEKERENSAAGEWRKGNLSRSNYIFEFDGPAGVDMLRMRLTPRRRDSRLVFGAALVTASSGDLVRVEGRLSKSPSFWVRWVNISSTYAPMAGTMMPVSVESTADVRIAGMSTFSMTYDYQTVAGQAVNGTPRFMAAR